jgi:hypothetical protein
MYPGITFVMQPQAGSGIVYWSSPPGSAAKGNIKVNYLIG